MADKLELESSDAKRQRREPLPQFDHASLPSHLRPRCRCLKPAAASSASYNGSQGQFVLYWMRNALRSSGNPALCTAVHASRMLSLPVLVLITVEDGGAHDTARRHTFLLQGVQDVSASLTNRGFTAAIYVQSEEGRVPWQFTLAYRAAVVITDEPFCDPWLSSCKELASKSFPAPLYAVDAACVVPCVAVSASACSRAGTYERATANARQVALSSPYLDTAYEPDSFPQPPVLFTSMPLTDIASLVSKCRVDHEVKACSHSAGGSGPGYKRWNAWVDGGGMKKYAATRNDVLRAGGVSRMSPYLNFGMVSPFRLALEGAKSPKFINEMQIWRELSYAWVFHHPDTYSSISGLPAWAQKYLATRPPPRQLLSLQQLATCTSGNALWDAMQRSLVLAGELHNNARMTWGKALLDWSLNGGDALVKLIYLNDHYALDGLAPPSYGGLMWCLGLFSGGPKVGSRPLGIQAARLDAAKLEQRTADLARFKSPA